MKYLSYVRGRYLHKLTTTPCGKGFSGCLSRSVYIDRCYVDIYIHMNCRKVVLYEFLLFFKQPEPDFELKYQMGINIIDINTRMYIILYNNLTRNTSNWILELFCFCNNGILKQPLRISILYLRDNKFKLYLYVYILPQKSWHKSISYTQAPFLVGQFSVQVSWKKNNEILLRNYSTQCIITAAEFTT